MCLVPVWRTNTWWTFCAGGSTSAIIPSKPTFGRRTVKISSQILSLEEKLGAQSMWWRAITCGGGYETLCFLMHVFLTLWLCVCILLVKTLAIKYMGAHDFIPFIHPPWRHGIQRSVSQGLEGLYNVLKQRWCTVISCFAMSHYGDVQSSVPCWTVALAWDLLIKMEEWPLQNNDLKRVPTIPFLLPGFYLGFVPIEQVCKFLWSWV